MSLLNMKGFAAFLYFICFYVHSFSEPIPAMSAPLVTKSLLLDIAIVGQSKLIAVGDRGHILSSHNAIDWQQAQVPIQAMLTAVFFLDAKNGWVVGHDASILHTQDGGSTWEIQQYLPELEKPLLDIVFKDLQSGLAIGAYGQLFRTHDGGKTWHYEFHDEFLLEDDREYLEQLKHEDEEAYLDERSGILPHFNRIFIDGRTLYLVGEKGLLAKSNDFGVTWNKFDDVYQGSFFDVTRTQEGNLLIAGLRGHIFRSMSNGAPWEMVDTGSTALINSIVLGDEGRLFLLGNNGLLLESVDDGNSYLQIPQQEGGAFMAGAWFNGQLVVVSDIGIKVLRVTK